MISLFCVSDIKDIQMNSVCLIRPPFIMRLTLYVGYLTYPENITPTTSPPYTIKQEASYGEGQRHTTCPKGTLSFLFIIFFQIKFTLYNIQFVHKMKR